MRLKFGYQTKLEGSTIKTLPKTIQKFNSAMQALKLDVSQKSM